MVAHYLNTQENFDYVGPLRDISYYVLDEMSGGERNEVFAWYTSQKLETFDNMRVLVSYTQDDVTVLRQACRVFRREFLQIGNMQVFLDSVKNSSAYNTLCIAIS